MRKAGVMPSAALIIFAFFLFAWAAYPEISVAAGPNAPAAEGAREMAFQHKKQGDAFRTQGRVANAAQEYDIALSLYDGFPIEDHLMMARFLSWSGKLDEAIRELRKILSKEPENHIAQTQLARCLSWKKDQTPTADLADDSTKVAVAAEGAETAESARVTAFRHKELGDNFREHGDVARAAQEYALALSLYDGFTIQDRFMMARFLSRGGMLDETIRELNKILSEEPENLEARIHLARCLSWKGDQAASLEESSKALAASPGNKEALLVRANALRWSGKQKEGVSIYREILEKEEDFDTRLGLSQVYLADGYLRGAMKEAGLLKPEYPYQKKELENLHVDIDKATRPDVVAGYSHYSDSDSNRSHRYNVSGGFWTGHLKWGVGYLYTDASGNGRSAQSHRATLSADSRPLEWLWVGGTAGYSRLEGGDSSGDFFVGSVRAGTSVHNGRFNLSMSRNVLTDTAELIDKQIRNTEVATNISYPLPYRFSLFAGYAHRDYSDNNRASDIYGMIRHRFGLRIPSISTGYRFRYLDFQRQSRGGYFDPSNYMSHRLDVALDYDKEKLYAYLCLYGGHQSFKRYEESASSFFGGWVAVLGMHVTKSIDAEIHGEGSGETGGSASGFRYNIFGARVKARF